MREDVIDEWPDEGGDGGRGSGINHHRGDGRDETPAVRAGVTEQARERIHSVNRYLNSTHSATKPSRQVIFFPSS